MWRFWFITWLGMLALVVLACAPPLFSRVAVSADMRAVAANSPDGQNIIVSVASISPTVTQVSKIRQQLDHLLKQGSFAPYLQGEPRLVVQTPPLTLSKAGGELVIDGYDPAQVAQHVTLVQGHLPEATNGDTIEVALKQEIANNLGWHINSVVQVHTPAMTGTQVWTLKVVGILAPEARQDSFWLAAANPVGGLLSTDAGSNVYHMLAAGETLRAKIAALQIPPGKDTAHLFWSYPFDSSHLDADTVAALSQQTSDLEGQIFSGLPQIQGVTSASPAGSLFETLSNYVQQVALLQIAIMFLLLLTLAIILLLVSMMADMQVERQATIIATLRSRGATQRHIFGTFVVQGIVIALVALLAGPLLTMVFVQAITRTLFSPVNQGALAVITRDPLQAIVDVKWFAIVAVIIALFVMILAVSRTAGLDIVTLRRETARTKRVPFWRRLNLDLIVVALILAGYIVYSYLWQTLTETQNFDPFLYNLLKVGGFVAPPLLVTAAILLFLRLFPLILRLVSMFAGKKRSAVAMLAFAQMERSPRPAARIIVLLMLAIASTCFLFTLIVTKQARTSEAATFAVGADFSGLIPTSDSFKTLDTLKKQYSNLPGVQSATVGYEDTLDAPLAEVDILAPDASTYARTALWPQEVAPQSLSTLTSQLVAHRGDATAHNVVYALVDATLWQKYDLSPGASFTLLLGDTGNIVMHFVALGQVSNIPATYNTPVDPESNIALVVDFQSYATVYARVTGTAVSPNYVWLHTSDNAATRIHSMFPALQDRRVLAEDNQQNSIHLDIMGVLGLAIGVTLLLALLGTLLSSWVSASKRLTSFALVRALGMAPRQVAAFLLWEQSLIYILALVSGIGIGLMLTSFVAPIISLLDLAGPAVGDNAYDLPAVQAVIPYPQLFLLLGGAVIVCCVVLMLMAHIVSRPSLGKTLRLNED
jgi:ABC-type lipoprotein release transport system permease subunit